MKSAETRRAVQTVITGWIKRLECKKETDDAPNLHRRCCLMRNAFWDTWLTSASDHLDCAGRHLSIWIQTVQNLMNSFTSCPLISSFVIVEQLFLKDLCVSVTWHLVLTVQISETSWTWQLTLLNEQNCGPSLVSAGTFFPPGRMLNLSLSH